MEAQQTPNPVPVLGEGKKQIYKAAAEAFVKEVKEFIQTYELIEIAHTTNYQGHGSWTTGNVFAGIYINQFQAREAELRDFLIENYSDKAGHGLVSPDYLEKVFKKFSPDSREGIVPVFNRLRLTIGWIAYMAEQIN